jgi:hypothetical protein
MSYRILIFVALATFVGGCTGASEEGSEPTKPPVAFEGKPDSRFAAVWKNADGSSTYTLKPDGKYRLESKVKTQGKTFDTNVAGEWVANGDRLLFKDAAGTVVPYKYTLAGNKLTLALTGSMKRETVLTKG